MRSTSPRRPNLKDRKRDETRGRLVAAGKRLFAEFGYDDVPVTEIAREAGVTHAMINVYFGGKAGLLYEIVRKNNDPQFAESKRIAEGEGPALDRLSKVLLFWTRTDGDDPRLLAVMQGFSWTWPLAQEVENASDRARHIEILAGLIREAIQNGEIPSASDPVLAAEAVFAIYTWGLRRIIFDGLTPEACHAKIFEQIGVVLLSRQ